MNFVTELPRNCAHCPYIVHNHHFGYFKCSYDDDNEFELDPDDLYYNADSRNDRCPLTIKEE